MLNISVNNEYLCFYDLILLLTEEKYYLLKFIFYFKNAPLPVFSDFNPL